MSITNAFQLRIPKLNYFAKTKSQCFFIQLIPNIRLLLYNCFTVLSKKPRWELINLYQMHKQNQRRSILPDEKLSLGPWAPTPPKAATGHRQLRLKKESELRFSKGHLSMIITSTFCIYFQHIHRHQNLGTQGNGLHMKVEK